jgi:hypothetical protein
MKFSNAGPLFGLGLAALASPACQTRSYPPLQRTQSVDIPRFMIKADYRVMYLAADYSETVIGQRLSALLDTQCYDTTLLRKVPQQFRGVPER